MCALLDVTFWLVAAVFHCVIGAVRFLLFFLLLVVVLLFAVCAHHYKCVISNLIDRRDVCDRSRSTSGRRLPTSTAQLSQLEDFSSSSLLLSFFIIIERCFVSICRPARRLRFIYFGQFAPRIHCCCYCKLLLIAAVVLVFLSAVGCGHKERKHSGVVTLAANSEPYSRL